MTRDFLHRHCVTDAEFPAIKTRQVQTADTDNWSISKVSNTKHFLIQAKSIVHTVPILNYTRATSFSFGQSVVPEHRIVYHQTT